MQLCKPVPIAMSQQDRPLPLSLLGANSPGEALSAPRSISVPNNRLSAALKRATAAPVPVTDPGEDNRRWAKRKSKHSPGAILFPGLAVPFTCTILDISSTGARIEIVADKYNYAASADALPTEFTLVMPFDKTEVECQSMWRRGPRMGVRFLGAVKPARPLSVSSPKKLGELGKRRSL